MTPLAAASAAIALLLWRPPGRWLVRQRLGLGLVRRTVRAPLLAGAVVGVVVIGPALGGVSASHAILAVTVAGVSAFAIRQLRAERRRARARKRRAAVTEAVGLMAAELRAGILPHQVLSGLVADFGFLRPAARAADLGGDVSAALRTISSEPGGELLAGLAGAWYVAERAGAPLARVLDRLEQTARDEHEIEREVQSELAPARATGRLMAVLPVFGLALGSGMGGDPVRVLTGTLPGVLCLAAGSALACAGVAWVERIASSGERAG
jgi:tight adherence protein B